MASIGTVMRPPALQRSIKTPAPHDGRADETESYQVTCDALVIICSVVAKYQPLQKYASRP
jgi:hypothetical protein